MPSKTAMTARAIKKRRMWPPETSPSWYSRVFASVEAIQQGGLVGVRGNADFLQGERRESRGRGPADARPDHLARMARQSRRVEALHEGARASRREQQHRIDAVCHNLVYGLRRQFAHNDHVIENFASDF